MTKRPTAKPMRAFSVGYNAKSLWSEHLDLGRQVGRGRCFRVSLECTHEKGRTYNGGALKRESVSLTLDAKLGSQLMWDF